jgi:hypothetical protein
LFRPDLCGPLKTARDGSIYFVTYTDEASNYTVVVNLKSKADTLKAFKDVLAWMERTTGRKLKALRSDGGGEYSSHAFKNFLKQKGIDHIITAPGTPQNNGGAERKNRSLLETMRAQMKQAGLGDSLWHLAVKAAAYVRNRTGFPRTPFEQFIGSKPNISNLKPLGCRAWVHIPSNKRSKRDSKSEETVLVGFEVGSRNYLFMRKHYSTFVSRDATFDEDVFPMREKQERDQNRKNLLQKSDEDYDSDSDPDDHAKIPSLPEAEDVSDQEPSAVQEVPRTNTRVRHPPGEWWKIQGNNTEDLMEYALSMDALPREPKTYAEAISGKDKLRWKEAMEEEIASLIKNDVYELVPLPTDRKIISCKWVFKIKTNPDNTIERYKARLVVRGFTQMEEIDVKEKFAPVTKYNSLRVLFAKATALNMDILQLDIKTAFLYGSLQEEVYMQQPPGFEVGKNLVCKLKRTLYGLKQAPRGWNIGIHSFLVSIGFKRTYSDHCVYVEKAVVLLLWVDDILLFGDKARNHTVYQRLAKEFDVTLLSSFLQSRTLSPSLCVISAPFCIFSAKYTSTPLSSQRGRHIRQILSTPRFFGKLWYPFSPQRPRRSPSNLEETTAPPARIPTPS